MLTPDTIGQLALEAMLSEVSATPKPGLVDRYNAGAHNDMDFFTFVKSTTSLYNGFYQLAQIGQKYKQRPIKDLWPYLEKQGQTMEQRMFKATNNVNTHKGMIFSLGIAVTCTSWLQAKNPNIKLSAQDISQTVAELCQDLCKKSFCNLSQKKVLTKGEQLYIKHGIVGARGEAESGFSTVLQVSLPIYHQFRKQLLSVNDALVQTLIYLMKYTEDTNVIARHDKQTANYVKMKASQVLTLGGILTKEGRQALSKLDQDFIDLYISPGGSADLLALTHFLYEVEMSY